MINKNRIIFFAIFFGLLILIFFQLNKQLSFPDQNWPVVKGEKIKIHSEVIQKFRADQNNLARIKILFGNSDVSPGGKFNLKIYEENCQDIIRETNLNISSLDSNNTTDFVFKKIKNSKDKIFCFKLSYKQKKNGKKAQLFVIDNSMEQNKFLSVNGEEKTGQSLAMRPAYKNNYLWQDFSQLNQRMSQYKPWFLKHYCLDFIIFSFILLSIVLVVVLVI